MKIWPVYVITLDRAAARGAASERFLETQGIAFTFTDGVDGRKLSDAQVAGVYDFRRNKRVFKYTLSRPEIGCYLSHHKLWAEVAASDHEGALILEDDFEAAEDLPRVLEAIMRLRLGAHVINLHAPARSSRRQVLQLTDRHSLVEPWIAPPRTTGYAISRDAAAILASRAVPFSRPVDIDLKHWWEFGITVLAIEPGALRTQSAVTADSAIEDSRRLARRSAPAPQRFIRNLKYQGRFQANLLLARWRRWRIGTPALGPQATLRSGSQG